MAAFCRQHGLCAVSLANWRRRLGGPDSRGAPATTAAPSQWLPVVMDCTPSSPALRAPEHAGYVLALHELRLEVPRGFDGDEVRALWSLLCADSEVRA